MTEGLTPQIRGRVRPPTDDELFEIEGRVAFALMGDGSEEHWTLRDIAWLIDAYRELRAVHRTLLGAVETMDRKVTPFGEREDGTVAQYIVADSTWHRVLAAARR